MAMFRRNRRSVVAAIGLACILLVALYWRAEQRQRLEITRKWARLAPYPESARDLRASTEGSMFTRSFRVSFTAPAADIERWLKDSPGTREATPDRPSPGKRHFAISPGGGAGYAEVTVDETLGLVTIYVCWS